MQSSAGSATNEVTEEERDYSVQLLKESHDRLTAILSTLSEEQWRFKPAAESWSIAETAEHVVAVEHSIGTRVLVALTGPALEGDSKTLDARVLKQVPDRSTKFPAPGRLVPTGTWTREEALRQLSEVRRKTIEHAQNPTGFRDHTVSHPIFGPLDGYQWVLAVAMHGERHSEQIREVQQVPGYPAAV